MKPLWPADYEVPDDHCGDVLRGSYDVPFNPDRHVTILDIGANVGSFTLWAKKRWPNSSVICYEPNPKTFGFLERTIRDNSLSGVLRYNEGVSNKRGRFNLSTGPHNSGEDSIMADYGTTYVPVDIVEASTLPHADIMKIDAEGVERQILEQLDSLGRIREFSAIMVETHSESDSKLVEALALRNDFRVTNRNYMHASRSEMCFVRRDLLPADFDAPKPKLTEKPTVWIATPLRKLEHNGAMTQEFIYSLDAAYRDPIIPLLAGENLKWRFEMMLVGGCGVARARNAVASWFMKSTAQYLFFVDYDLKPTTADYLEVLNCMERNGVPVCGGLYTIRKKDGHWVINYPDANGPREDGALQVAELGTGFKCYHRSALERVLKANPWLTYEDEDTKETQYGFFSMGPVKDEKFWPGKTRWLTEDYWLDWLTREAGMPIVVTTKVQLKHFDDITGQVFPLRFPPVPRKWTEDEMKNVLVTA